MRYLVTGGAGFIGSHLAEHLADDGHELVILDDLSTGCRENVAGLLDGGEARLVEGSVTDALLVDELMREADVCLHLASAVGVKLVVEHPLETLLANVRGSDVVMGAAARHGVRLLFTSTSEVYGKSTAGSLREDDDLRLGSPSRSRWSYAIAKCFGETLAHSYHRDLEADVVVVRLFNTVGARQTGRHGMVLPRLVSQALAADDLTVYGDGTQTRCFVHVKDTVEAIARVSANREATGAVYNIGNPVSVSILELAARVIARAGSASRIMLVPYDAAYPPGFEELGRRRPDIAEIQALTGWRPTRTLDEAIDDVIAHEQASAAAMRAELAVDAA
jgi:UDP-glucose 4-epimerase